MGTSESQRRRGKRKQAVGFWGCSSKAFQFHFVTLDHSYILLPLVCFFPCCLLLNPFSLPWQHVIYTIQNTLNYIRFFHLFTNMLNYFYSWSYFNQTFWKIGTFQLPLFSFSFDICHIWATVWLFLSPVSSVFWLLEFMFCAYIGVTCPQDHDTLRHLRVPCFDSLQPGVSVACHSHSLKKLSKGPGAHAKLKHFDMQKLPS